ncbi:hypothetical protein HOP50_13g70170 [Chloropicon primus]|uniref:C3H1-type domain-containing protein n=1 Tax=Chloropicon primus TaxID=1764295 RepID=A0A5B8MUK5_9CHLO|nr:hypothetical protein A3770_13p69960 [Chloropicon primus]UPR03687.1 hypothetical protein HOP50_13g70170 [Chloropicon primus]|eukprot:QDZ24478.1 hypothetical protein A3770_13p69960 [Chloropicon primus]
MFQPPMGGGEVPMDGSGGFQNGRQGNIARPGMNNFKTRLCSMFSSTGACPYGDHCSFAHGEGELNRSSMQNSTFQRRTRPCNKFNTPQGCPYGENCNFIHDVNASPFALLPGPGGSGGEAQVCKPVKPPQQMPLNYKTRLCVRFESGACPFGEKCHFAHGKGELRDAKANRAMHGDQERQLGMGQEAGGMQLNPPNSMVTFLFTRRSLEPKPIELKAPPVDVDSNLAKLREANKKGAREDWLQQGGSDVYGDKVIVS